MKLIYSVVFIIIIIIGIYLYLFIQDRKNKGKENKETYLNSEEVSFTLRRKTLFLFKWKGCFVHPFQYDRVRV